MERNIHTGRAERLSYDAVGENFFPRVREFSFKYDKMNEK